MARTRRTRHGRRIPLLGIAVLLAASACGGSSADSAVESAASTAAGAGGDGSAAPAEMTKVRVGWALTDSAPLLLGVDEGVFERNGIDVELSETATTDLVGSVLSKKTDFGANTGTGMVLGIGKGIPITAACGLTTFAAGAEGSSGSNFLVKKGSGIETARDLEGKKVGVNLLSSASEYAAREVVDEAGGDSSLVQIVEVPFASMGDAISSGNVDAAEVAEPFASQSLATGDFEAPIGDPIEIVFGEAPRIVMTMLAEYGEKNPDVVKRFCQGVADSLEMAKEDPDALHPIYEKYFKLSPELAETQKLNELKTELTPASFKKINEIFVKYGGISSPVPDDKLVG